MTAPKNTTASIQEPAVQTDQSLCAPQAGSLQWQWVRKPDVFSISDSVITVKTEPHTDLWQRTYYHFRNDSAPLLLAFTKDQYFSFTVRTDFSGASHRFDQCGIAVYLDSDNWIKASVEYENEHFAHLGCVVTSHGYSDWSTVEIPAKRRTMYYRLSRRHDDFCVENSVDGIVWQQMRICHLHDAQDGIRIGLYACSPEESSFEAVFTDFHFTECAWKAHDGQQPDDPALY